VGASADGQSRPSPTASLLLGGATTMASTTLTGGSQTADESGRLLLAAVAIGARLGTHVAFDITGRTSFGVGRPVRVVSVGPSLLWGRRYGVSLRAGVARIEGAREESCPSARCAAASFRREWATGVDVSGAIDAPMRGRLAIGPELWYAVGARDRTLYRTVGGGVRVRYR
jgi:hypothetical protein